MSEFPNVEILYSQYYILLIFHFSLQGSEKILNSNHTRLRSGKAAWFLLCFPWSIDSIEKKSPKPNTRDNKNGPIREEFITSELMIFSQE